MKVLFLQDVLNVADAGQMKEVANGYARNYLIPRQLAVAATKGQQKQIEQHKQAIERRRAKELDQQRQLAATLDGTTITIEAKVGGEGRLFGSVTTADIATRLEEAVGSPVDRRKIDLSEPIRSVGEHQVPIRFSREVGATVTVNVVPEGEIGA